MRISDWSSDVCSSDLLAEVGIGDVGDQQGDHGRRPPRGGLGREVRGVAEAGCRLLVTLAVLRSHAAGGPVEHTRGDRKSVESGKSVSVRVDLGGSGIHKQTNKRKRINRKIKKT